MVEQSKTVTNNIAREEQRTDRTKAAFSLLDHFVKAYNNGETYIKRGLTLFGLGSILAGASFSVGQRLPNHKVTLPQNSSDTPTANVSSPSTSQAPAQPAPQPQIIYITPPTQAIAPASPTPEPVVKTPPIQSPSVPEELSQVKQTLDSVQQISGAMADIQQDFNPLFEGEDD
ncbi:hypothetical protein STA3757_21730 [Stanieria sp. NIES-3757]|nr:hypothetical protein STA3757_21730 [Stanieria sp. NIES-3757]